MANTILREYTKANKFSAWTIVEAKKKDLETEYTVQINFMPLYAIVTFTWDIKLEMFKKLLDWMDHLNFRFYIEADTRYFLDKINIFKECLKEIENRIEFRIDCDRIMFDFKHRTDIDIIDDYLEYNEIKEFSKLLKIMWKINSPILVQSLVWTISDLFNTILNWKV